MPASVLVAWAGATDLRAPEDEAAGGAGPLAQAVANRDVDEVVVLADYPKGRVEPYRRWLARRTKSPLTIDYRPLPGPTDFGAIYQAVVASLEHIARRHLRTASSSPST